MSIIELEYPPFLTPRLLSNLNGKLDDTKRAALRSFLDLTIEQCFKPFARYRGIQYAKRLRETVQKYQPYRLWLVAKLFEFLGKNLLLKLVELANQQWGLNRQDDWGRLGVNAKTMQSIFARYGKSVKRLLSPSVSRAGWPNAPTNAMQRLVDSSVWIASNLDFAITSLCLILEGEIHASRKTIAFLVRAAKEAIRSYEAHVDTLCREPVKLEEYFYQLLMEQDLWTASEKEDFPTTNAAPFRPIVMAGKPLSEMILEDRR